MSRSIATNANDALMMPGVGKPSWASKILRASSRAILVLLLVFAAWTFGGMQPQVQVWFFVAVGVALAMALLADWIDPSVYFPIPMAILPPLLLLILGTLQLIPLGEPVRSGISPKAAELRESLASEANPSDAMLVSGLDLPPVEASHPVSLNPASTRHDLAMLTLAVAVFVAGFVLFRTPQAFAFLVIAAAINGAALAFFGFIQRLSWNGMLFWTVPLTKGGNPFASFVNRNNAGGYLNLCLACALGIVFWWAIRDRLRAGKWGTSAGCPDDRPANRGMRNMRDWRNLVDAPVIAGLALCGTIVAGVFCSLSRGAMVAMVGAAVVTFFALAIVQGRRFLGRLLLTTLVGAAGVFLIFWIGFQDQVVDRAATLLDTPGAAAGRIDHWTDGLASVHDFWASGSGLGTYRYVYAPYQDQPSHVWYYHAENCYLEMLVEGGVIGLVLLLSMVVLIALAAWKLLKAPNGSAYTFLGIVGIFALASQVIHSMTDFGLYIPANMLLFSLLCGAVCGAAAEIPGGRFFTRLPTLPLRRFGLSALLTVVLVAVVWAGWENRRAATVVAQIERTCWSDDRPPVSPAEMQRAISRLEWAVAARPDDADGHLQLARLWTQFYRVETFDNLGGNDLPDAEAAELWDSTSTIALHGLAHRLNLRGKHEDLEKLRTAEHVTRCLLPALSHMVLARRACPVLPEVHARLAELSFIQANPSLDEIHLERVKSLVAGHPDMLYRCGVLELQAGRLDAACASWRTSLVSGDHHLRDILAMAGRQISLWHLVHRVLPESPEKLLQLARYNKQVLEQPILSEMLVDQAEKIARQSQLPPAEQAHVMGVICLFRNQNEQAIQHFRQALDIRWDNDEWRYDLALALKGGSQLDAAREQARICVQRSPNNPRYRILLTEIHHNRILREDPL